MKIIVVVLVLACSVYTKHLSLHRYWNPTIVDHFYTTNFKELGYATTGWTYEGVQCRILQHQYPNTKPLYRYWNGRDHFYTTNPSEIGTTVPGKKGNGGYTSEGVTGFCFEKHVRGTVPLHRYWKPNGQDHFYTTNLNEIGTHAPGQVGHGYTNEGVVCYVIPKQLLQDFINSLNELKNCTLNNL